MNKNIWIVIVAILVISTLFWLYKNKWVEKDIDKQGEEIMNDMFLPLPESE